MPYDLSIALWRLGWAFSEHVESYKTSVEPVSPFRCFSEQVGTINVIVLRGTRMVVRSSCPQVAFVVVKMLAQPPGSQVKWIASGSCDVACCDSIPRQISQVSSIELHGSDIVRAVPVRPPLSRPATFFFSNCQNDICGDPIANGRRNRADNPGLYLWWRCVHRRS